MEPNILALIAAVGGFAVPTVMGAVGLSDLLRSRRIHAGDGDYLRLVVNGKDYSVDLKTIGNGGSERISAALADLEECA